jgi:S1/P1 Nuclease
MKIFQRLLVIVSLSLPLLPQNLHAWADGGHKSIALIAWEKLGDADRKWVADLLKQHPKYEEHFAAKMKSELPKDADEAATQRWLFAQAAVWPDMVRPPRGSKEPNPNEQYHHATWHYLDVPVFPDGAERSSFRTLKEEPDTAWPPLKADAELNAAQALKKAMHDLKDATIPAPDRAVMLCWLFHVLGDVHQPCHAAALYYPKKLWSGDRGANGVTIKGLPIKPLHAYWDDLIGGPGTDSNHAYDNARALLNDSALVTNAEAVLNIDTPEGWVTESSVVAKQYVYPPPVMKGVGEAKPAGYTKNGVGFFSVTIELTQPEIEKYQADALSVARQRIVTAGLRLAKAVKAAEAK